MCKPENCNCSPERWSVTVSWLYPQYWVTHTAWRALGHLPVRTRNHQHQPAQHTILSSQPFWISITLLLHFKQAYMFVLGVYSPLKNNIWVLTRDPSLGYLSYLPSSFVHGWLYCGQRGNFPTSLSAEIDRTNWPLRCPCRGPRDLNSTLSNTWEHEKRICLAKRLK